MVRKTHEKFEQELKDINPNIQLISQYQRQADKVSCKCKICNHEWKALPSNLLKGKGCPKCGKKSTAEKQRKTTEQFIKEAIEVHSNTYDYSQVNYVNAYTPVKIICPTHGVFAQFPTAHIFKQCGCPKCSCEKTHNAQRFTQEQFIEKAKKIHGNRYDYSKVNYTGMMNKVCIICPEHGEFWQVPNKHINARHGCPVCKYSHGEELIFNWLKTNNFNYKPQYKIEWDENFRNTNVAYVDFCVQINNHIYFIEYNGQQHYEILDVFGGEDVYKLQIYRDEQLRKYCSKHNIRLLEIKYNLVDEEIINELKNFLHE